MSEHKNNITYPPFAYAGFFLRLVAFTIDMVVISAVHKILVSILGIDFNIINALSLHGLVYWISLLAYFTLMTYMTNGQTLGKMITNIRVVSTNGKKLELFQVVSRETFGRYVQNKFMILYIIIGFAPMKQSLMDILSDTVVVKESVSGYIESEI